MRFFSLLFLLYMLIPFSHSEEKIRFEIKVPDEVVSGEQFRVSFVLDGGEGKNFNVELKDLKNTTLLYGPSTSMSTSSRYDAETGKPVVFRNQSYIFVVQAGEKGSIVIPPATIDVDNKTYSTKEQKIKIVKRKSSSKDEPVKDKKKKDINDKDVFLKTIVSKKTLGLDESLEVTFRLFTKWDVASVADYSLPSFSDFFVSEIPLPRDNDFEDEKYNGQNYKAIDLKRYKLVPRKKGSLSIEPFSLYLFLETERDKEKREKMSNQERRNSIVDKKISSEKINITVGTVL